MQGDRAAKRFLNCEIGSAQLESMSERHNLHIDLQTLKDDMKIEVKIEDVSGEVREIAEARKAGIAVSSVKISGVNKRVRGFLPSVDRLDILNYSRLKTKFPWFTPLPLDYVWGNCHLFFRQAVRLFPKETEEAMKKIPQSAREKACDLFLQGKMVESSSDESSDGSP